MKIVFYTNADSNYCGFNWNSDSALFLSSIQSLYLTASVVCRLICILQCYVTLQYITDFFCSVFKIQGFQIKLIQMTHSFEQFTFLFNKFTFQFDVHVLQIDHVEKFNWSYVWSYISCTNCNRHFQTCLVTSRLKHGYNHTW